jgi:hypothetical protein
LSVRLDLIDGLFLLIIKFTMLKSEIPEKSNSDKIQREITLLKDYAKALEIENATRNEERKTLEK